MASLKPFSPSKATACSTKAHVEASLSASRQATFVGGNVPRLQQRDPSVARERRVGCASEVGGRSIALLPAPQPAYPALGGPPRRYFLRSRVRVRKPRQSPFQP